MEKILVAGLNCRAVALSAKRLGLQTYVVDYFGDVDLKRAIDGVFTIGRHYSAEKLTERTRKIAERIQPDGLLLTSELGCNPEYVEELEKTANIIGNTSERVRGVRDWESFFQILDEMGIKHPRSLILKRVDKMEEQCAEIGYPLVAKPIHGSAGLMVEMCYSARDVLIALKLHKELLIQEYIKGLNASVSMLCSEKKTIPVSLNEQLLGVKELGQGKEFGYCGNIVPLESKLMEKCFRIGKKICERFDLRGTIGIDIVLDKEPFVIEVNPRFQDTIECIEKVYRINLVKMHLNACSNSIEAKKLSPKGFWCKGIIYAERNLKITGDLTKIENCADILRNDTTVDAGSPVCSVFGSAKSRDGAFDSMKDKIVEVRRYLRGI